MSNPYRYSRVNNVVNCIRNASVTADGDVHAHSWMLIVRRAHTALVYQGQPNTQLAPTVRTIANEVLAMNQLLNLGEFRIRWDKLRIEAQKEAERRAAELALNYPLPREGGLYRLAQMVLEVRRRLRAAKIDCRMPTIENWSELFSEAKDVFYLWTAGGGAPRSYNEIELAREILLQNDELPSGAVPIQYGWLVIETLAENISILPTAVKKTPETDPDIWVKSALVENTLMLWRNLARSGRVTPSMIEWEFLSECAGFICTPAMPPWNPAVTELARQIVRAGNETRKLRLPSPMTSSWYAIVRCAENAKKGVIASGEWRLRKAIDTSDSKYLAKLILLTRQANRGGRFLSQIQWDRIVGKTDELFMAYRNNRTYVTVTGDLLQLARDVKVMDANSKSRKQLPLAESFETLCNEACDILGVPRLDQKGSTAVGTHECAPGRFYRAYLDQPSDVQPSDVQAVDEKSHPYNAEELKYLWDGINPNIKLAGFNLDGLVRFARRWSSLTIQEQNQRLRQLQKSSFVVK